MTILGAPSRFRVPSFDLHDRLSKARAEAEITQARMGELLGVSRRTIVRYETAGQIVPRAVILAYHVATETDLEWLETGKAPEPSDGPEGGGVVTPIGAGVRSKGLEPPTFCSVVELAVAA